LIVISDLLTKNLESFLVNKEKKRNEWFEKKRKESPSEPPKFYPSGIGYCTNKLIYQMLGYPQKPKGAKFLRITSNGDYMHERYQSWLLESKIAIGNEFPIRDEELLLSGRIDSLLDAGKLVNSMQGDVIPLELKSAKKEHFEEMQENNSPLSEHIDQLQLYMHLLECPMGIVFVENKNTQDTLEFWIERDLAHGQRLVEKIKFINQCVRDAVIPESRDRNNPNCDDCHWCDFKQYCWHK
jgi:hypothetical protein